MAEQDQPQDEPIDPSEEAVEAVAESTEQDQPAGQDDVEAAAPTEEPSEGDELPEAPERTDATPEVETEPFGFTVDKRRVDVQGAEIVRFKDEAGNPVEKVVIPRDAWNRFVQPNLRDQAALQRRDAEHRQQIAALDPERNETVVRARALLGSLEGVLKDEESLTGFLQNFQANKELWQLKAEKAVADARLHGLTSQEDERTQAARNEEIAGNIAQDIPAFTAQAGQWVSENWKVPVDARALQAAQQHITENIGSYYRYATDHDAQAYGVEKGTLVRDDDAVLKTIHRFASLLSTTAKVEDVKTNNARALAAPKKAPPKTVPAKGSPAASEKPKTFKTQDEWKRHMGLNT